MKLITREIDYAVRALKYIAEKGKEKVPVAELVEDLGITRPMLRKIMQELAKAGMVVSYKGNNGGFTLSKRPGDIYLLELVEIFQGKFSLNECVLNKGICPNRKSCILKGKIEDIEENVKRQLESINLKSLMIKEGN
jgi:Rrf2 family protein